MSQYICNSVASSEEGQIGTKLYPIRNLEPTPALVRCRTGAINITGQCAAPTRTSSLPLPVPTPPQITAAVLGDALRQPGFLAGTVTVYHPYGHELQLVQFLKTSAHEYMIIQWNVAQFACCHSPSRDSEMFGRYANADQVLRIIEEIVRGQRCQMPHEPAPIVFQSDLGETATVYLLPQ